MSSQTTAPSTLELPADECIPTAAQSSREDAWLTLLETDRTAALTEIYRRHYRMIASYLYRRTGDPHLAEDLAAETFLAAFRTVDRLRKLAVPARFWLLRIATNASHRWMRGTRRRIAREQAREQAQPQARTPPEASRSDSTDSHQPVRSAVARLPRRFQAVIALHYFAGLAVQEVALVLECSEGTVKSRLSRGRDRLRRDLESTGGAV
ncbi:MAG: RNA polymerase sigma factor [Phycisphaerales bacterium]|nr:RNA polymerase sigma factor [Phycisphaerales bacterium]